MPQAFDVSYSLNGRHWFRLGRVSDLPPISSTGAAKYYGEFIQNRSAGGREKVPFGHRKAALIEVRAGRPACMAGPYTSR